MRLLRKKVEISIAADIRAEIAQVFMLGFLRL